MTTNIMLAVSGNWFGVAWYWYVLALVALILQSGFVLIPINIFGTKHRNIRLRAAQVPKQLKIGVCYLFWSNGFVP